MIFYKSYVKRCYLSSLNSLLSETQYIITGWNLKVLLARSFLWFGISTAHIVWKAISETCNDILQVSMITTGSMCVRHWWNLETVGDTETNQRS